MPRGQYDRAAARAKREASSGAATPAKKAQAKVKAAPAKTLMTKKAAAPAPVAKVKRAYTKRATAALAGYGYVEPANERVSRQVSRDISVEIRHLTETVMLINSLNPNTAEGNAGRLKKLWDLFDLQLQAALPDEPAEEPVTISGVATTQVTISGAGGLVGTGSLAPFPSAGPPTPSFTPPSLPTNQT